MRARPTEPLGSYGWPWLVLVGLGLATPVVGQVPDPEAGSLGWGASTATARGFAATAGNPAALGLERSAGWTVAALSFGLGVGLDPISLQDLADWEGRDVPDAIRERWLAEVTRGGAQAGSGSADLTLLALSRGPVGFQLSTSAGGTLDLNPDAMELVLFGNAGLTGEPRDFRLAGSRGSGFAVSTGAVAFGRVVAEPAGGALAVGATLSVSVGHLVAVAEDNGTGFEGDPVELDLRFPILHQREGAGLRHGAGVGSDLGALWERAHVRLGLVIKNVFHTFEWNLQDLVFRPGSAVFTADESDSDFDSRPASEAPPVLLDALRNLDFKRELRVGGEVGVRDDLTVVGELRVREAGGMTTQPKTYLGVGAELRPRDRLTVRGGVAIVTGGFQLSGGLGLDLGRVRIAGGAGIRTAEVANTVLGSFGISLPAGSQP